MLLEEKEDEMSYNHLGGELTWSPGEIGRGGDCARGVNECSSFKRCAVARIPQSAT